MCKFLWERDQNKVSQRAAWKERILSPHFKGGSEAQRKQTIIQTCRRKTVTRQTRFQAPNPQMAGTVPGSQSMSNWRSLLSLQLSPGHRHHSVLSQINFQMPEV